MKAAFTILFINIVPIILACLACWMVVNDKDNWGWVIFAAIILVTAPKKIRI